MITFKKSWLLVLNGLVIIGLLAVILFRTPAGPEVAKMKEIPEIEADSTVEEAENWYEYSGDSTYLMDLRDSTICIYKLISTLPYDGEGLNSMAIHPSGSHLLLLNDQRVMIYNVKRDNLAYTGPPSDRYESPWLEIEGANYLEFSRDGRFLMVIDYTWDQVDMYKWPGLDHLDTGNIGYWHNCTWKNHDGKFVFEYYYEGYKKYIYQFVFPAGPRNLVFSEHVCIDSLPIDTLDNKVVKNR